MKLKFRVSDSCEMEGSTSCVKKDKLRSFTVFTKITASSSERANKKISPATSLLEECHPFM